MRWVYILVGTIYLCATLLLRSPARNSWTALLWFLRFQFRSMKPGMQGCRIDSFSASFGWNCSSPDDDMLTVASKSVYSATWKQNGIGFITKSNQPWYWNWPQFNYVVCTLTNIQLLADFSWRHPNFPYTLFGRRYWSTYLGIGISFSKFRCFIELGIGIRFPEFLCFIELRIGISFPKFCCFVARGIEIWNRKPNSVELDYNYKPHLPVQSITPQYCVKLDRIIPNSNLVTSKQ